MNLCRILCIFSKKNRLLYLLLNLLYVIYYNDIRKIFDSEEEEEELIIPEIKFIKLDITGCPRDDPIKSYCDLCCYRISQKCNNNNIVIYKCLKNHTFYIENDKQVKIDLPI